MSILFPRNILKGRSICWHYIDIKRIEEMEALYDALLQAVAEIEQGCAAEAAARKTAMQPEIDRLAAYYSSEAWKADFAADEAGFLPAGMKRGVLSEDGIYTFLERFSEVEQSN